MKNSRRQFMILSAAGACTLALHNNTQAQGAKVDERDPAAVGLGYVANRATVNKAKYRNFNPNQACGNCALFQGKPNDAMGGCPLFAGRAVASQGWCSAWAPRK
jgi:hypothetical protein